MLHEFIHKREADRFAELARRYADLVYGACLRVTRNVHDAEDAAQDCFLKFLRHIDTIQSSPAGWLHTTAVHCAIAVIRKASTRRRYESQVPPPPAPSAAEPTWDDISPHVDKAIAELPEPLRAPLVMHYLEGLPQTRIAEELGVNQSTVSRRIEKALHEVSARLKKAGVAAPALLLALLLEREASAACAPASLMTALGKMAILRPRPDAGQASPAGVVSAGTASKSLRLLAGSWQGKAVLSVTLGLLAAVSCLTFIVFAGRASKRRLTLQFAAFQAGRATLPAGGVSPRAREAERVRAAARAVQANRRRIRSWRWAVVSSSGAAFVSVSDGTNVCVQRGDTGERLVWRADGFARFDPASSAPGRMRAAQAADVSFYDPRSRLLDIEPEDSWRVVQDAERFVLERRLDGRRGVLTLDPRRGFAVVRRVTREPGRTAAEEFRVERFGRVWFPKTITRVVRFDDGRAEWSAETTEWLAFNRPVQAAAFARPAGASVLASGGRTAIASALAHPLWSASREWTGAAAAGLPASDDILSLALAYAGGNALSARGGDDLAALADAAQRAGVSAQLKTASWDELASRSGCAVVRWSDLAAPALLLPLEGDQMALVDAGLQWRVVNRDEFRRACAGRPVLLLDPGEDETEEPGPDAGCGSSSAERGARGSDARLAPSQTSPAANASESESFASHSESESFGASSTSADAREPTSK